ncbi:hypothetical protein CMMCAS05_05545 [Clavibacter michiganensis subsp. michiganensis]|nr:hypothetical protein CMMCAS05_05545 [Clavibacter michiganensis subsp. michiganensis]
MTRGSSGVARTSRRTRVRRRDPAPRAGTRPVGPRRDAVAGGAEPARPRVRGVAGRCREHGIRARRRVERSGSVVRQLDPRSHVPASARRRVHQPHAHGSGREHAAEVVRARGERRIRVHQHAEQHRPGGPSVRHQRRQPRPREGPPRREQEPVGRRDAGGREQHVDRGAALLRDPQREPEHVGERRGEATAAREPGVDGERAVERIEPGEPRCRATGDGRQRPGECDTVRMQRSRPPDEPDGGDQPREDVPADAGRGAGHLPTLFRCAARVRLEIGERHATTPEPTRWSARASGGAVRRSAARYGVGMPPLTFSVSPTT